MCSNSSGFRERVTRGAWAIPTLPAPRSDVKMAAKDDISCILAPPPNVRSFWISYCIKSSHFKLYHAFQSNGQFYSGKSGVLRSPEFNSKELRGFIEAFYIWSYECCCTQVFSTYLDCRRASSWFSSNLSTSSLTNLYLSSSSLVNTGDST